MKYDIIKTDKYLLVVDDSEIREGDWYFWGVTNSVQKAKKDSLDRLPANQDGSNKIITHLPLNNSPILEGVNLLPPFEDDVWNEFQEIDGSCERGQYEHWLFKAGYNKAKEKYKYTEEDMRFAIKSAFMQGVERVPYLHQLEDNIIKSLQQPKYPIAFECEDKIYRVKSGTIQELKDGNGGHEYYEWIGKYIY
jgi:hypothetical protein